MRGLCYFFLSVLTQVSSSTFEVTGLVGHNVTMPCRYDVQTYGILSFCWGREKVPTSKCSNTILSSEDGDILLRQSPRYQLLGRVADGDVSLTILNAQWADAGVYGCRVEIPGWFNDLKVNTHLIMEEAPVEPATFTTDRTQEILTTVVSKMQNLVTPPLTLQIVTTEEGFKTFLVQGNIGRMAAIFILTIIIILVFVFWKGVLPRRKHLNTSAAENIYESLPVPE